RADVPVLITGPNGTGKERIAEIIQANSSVRNGPFVTLNCGALPSELIEAELFGADVGAYTGASKAREGKFEAADGGTLFLDEIGNLPPAGQMKLLRVLETGRFERLGSNRERPGNVRELKNVMQRANLLAVNSAIEASDLGLPTATPAPISNDSEPDRESIERALSQAGGVVSQAAAELGLSRQALYRRMERLGI